MKQSLLKKISKVDDCWIWIGATDKDGFPRLGGVSARQVVYRAVRGDLSEECLTPKCEKRLCVNPDHLTPIRRDEVPVNTASIETRKTLDRLKRL